MTSQHPINIDQNDESSQEEPTTEDMSLNYQVPPSAPKKKKATKRRRPPSPPRVEEKGGDEVEDERAPSGERKSKKARMQMPPSKHWVFTLNNPGIDDALAYEMLKTWPANYVSFQREVGETGTEHLQGYVEFDKPFRLTSVRKLPLGGMMSFQPLSSFTSFYIRKQF